MPIPVVTDHALVQVVMPVVGGSATGNKFVNTWFFRNDTLPDDFSGVFANAVRTALDAFYDGNLGTSPTRLTPFLSPVIDRTAIQYRIYDLGVAAPRTPVLRTPTVQWAAAGAGAKALPNEVAAVLSYRSGPPGQSGGTLNRRARGRLYIGPFTDQVVKSYVAGELDAQLTDTVRTRIKDGAVDVLNSSQPLTWTQYSRAGNVMSEVTGGFVDNRFDTQRRRGEEAATRIVWP